MFGIKTSFKMNKKKVGFICTSKSSGGLEMLMSNVCLWLQQRGNDCIFICSENSFIHNFTGKNAIKSYELRKSRKLFDFKTAGIVKEIIKKENISTIISGDNRDLNLCYLVKKMTGEKLKHIYIQNMQIGIKKKDLYHTIMHRKIDYWVSPLEWLKKQAMELTNLKPEKIKVIPHGFDARKFSEEKISKYDARKLLGLKQNEFYFGILGRIDVKKGQEFLIRAVNILNNQRKQSVNLVIGGAPTEGEGTDYYKHLKKLAKEFKIEDNVKFAGFIENTSGFYRALDVFTMASESETYGLVTLEAMASGLLVIGTNRGGTKEILNSGELGYLFEPDNMNQFCEIIEKIKNKNFNTEEIILKAKEIAISKYSKDKQCELLEKLI